MTCRSRCGMPEPSNRRRSDWMCCTPRRRPRSSIRWRVHQGRRPRRCGCRVGVLRHLAQFAVLRAHHPERLVEVGIEDFSDTRVDVALLRSLYDPLHPNTKRSACHLLCRVVRENHPNGRALATALGNSRFIVLESQTFAYDDAVAEAIEASARAVYTARYTEARELFGSLWLRRGWPRLAATHGRRPRPMGAGAAARRL